MLLSVSSILISWTSQCRFLVASLSSPFCLSKSNPWSRSRSRGLVCEASAAIGFRALDSGSVAPCLPTRTKTKTQDHASRLHKTSVFEQVRKECSSVNVEAVVVRMCYCKSNVYCIIGRVNFAPRYDLLDTRIDMTSQEQDLMARLADRRASAHRPDLF